VKARGYIYNAAVSGLDAITGKRAYLVVTFEHFPAGPSQEGAPKNLEATNAIARRVQTIATSDVLPNGMVSQVSGSGVLGAAPITYKVLNFALVDPAKVSDQPAFNKAVPVTNPGALTDQTELDVLGIKGSIALVSSVLAALGSVLLGLILYLLYFIYTHRAEMRSMGVRIAHAANRNILKVEHAVEHVLHLKDSGEAGWCASKKAVNASIPGQVPAPAPTTSTSASTASAEIAPSSLHIATPTEPSPTESTHKP